MKKIESLTKEQEAKVSVYLQKWLAIGRSTGKLDHEKTKEAIKTIYRCSKREEPKYFFFFPSPFQSQLAVNILKQSDLDIKNLLNERDNLGANLRDNLLDNLGDNLWANLGDNLGANLWANLWANLRDNLWANLGDNLGANLRDNLWDNLGDNLGANLRDNLGANLGENLRENLRDNLKTECLYMFYGNVEWDIGWIGFYDYILNELFEERISEFKDFVQFCEAMNHVHMFIPYKDIVFISDKPEEINLNQQGQLHADLKPALSYTDGYSLFYLNGIRVKKEIIEANPETFTKDMILKEQSTDVKREIIRKIGMKKVSEIFDAKVLDQRDGYRLLSFDLGDGRIRPYVEMKCPSSGLIYIEGARPEHTTLDEAIAYQHNEKNMKEVNIIWER